MAVTTAGGELPSAATTTPESVALLGGGSGGITCASSLAGIKPANMDAIRIRGIDKQSFISHLIPQKKGSSRLSGSFRLLRLFSAGEVTIRPMGETSREIFVTEPKRGKNQGNGPGQSHEFSSYF